MVVRVAAVASLLVLGLVAVPVQAQSDGSSFAGTDGTLYLHMTREGGFSQWMNTLADDPANQGSDDGWNILGFALGGGTHTAEFPMTPELAAPVGLTKDADVTFDLWVGGSAPDQNGQVTVKATLRSGATVVAETAASSTVTYQGDMHQVTLTAPAQVDGLAVGDALTLQVDLEGVGTFIHIGNGEPTQSKVLLPIIPMDEPAGATYEDLEGPTVTLATTIANTTSRLDVYNWTAPNGALQATYNATVGNGSVAFSIRDADNVTVEGNLTATGNDSVGLGDLAPGNWTITVTYTDFDGTFNLGIAPAQDASTTSSSSSSSSSRTGGLDRTSNGTANASSSTSAPAAKDSPDAGAVSAAAVALAAAVFARRRRA